MLKIQSRFSKMAVAVGAGAIMATMSLFSQSAWQLFKPV